MRRLFGHIMFRSTLMDRVAFVRDDFAETVVNGFHDLFRKIPAADNRRIRWFFDFKLLMNLFALPVPTVEAYSREAVTALRT